MMHIVSSYTMAVMDRLRSFCDIETEEPLTKDGINFEVVVPSKVERFKIVPHNRLMYLSGKGPKSEKWVFLTAVKDQADAVQSIYMFLRGLNPSELVG